MRGGISRGRSGQIAAVLAPFFLATLLAGAPAAEETCAARPYVVKVHADWCGTCKSLESTWTRVERELADEATVVEFDVSDRKAYEHSRELAERLGIADFFQAHRSRTGTVAVLDCETLEPVVILRGERDFEKYREAVSRAGHSS
jgi:thiol-disulfide isomerase/thioredoxin